MALVRVYCGLASADLNPAPPGSETWLTVAVVDDAGRLLEICDISDDAPGFAELGSLLAERSNGLESVAIAADSDEHIVTRLLTAAGRYLAYTDEDSSEDYAERFGSGDNPDEIQSSPAERRAIGLARALQAGVLSAVAQPTPRDLIALKPVLAAHAAVTNGRQSAASTLREVLRELYPAALRAFPDPAEPIPLAILDALPEPGPLGTNSTGRGRDAQAIAELAEAGVADAATLTESVGALRVAIAETPRRTGMNRSITNAVAETVRQSVAAVRACDAGAAALVSVLAARMPTAATPTQQPTRARSRSASASGPAGAMDAVGAVDAMGAGTATASGASPLATSSQPQTTPATPATPAAPAAAAQPPAAPPAAAPATTPEVRAAVSGSHRAAGDTSTADSPAPRTRAARRAAEKQAEERSAAQSPTPVQTPAAAPVPIHVPTPPVPLQAPPAPLPVPPPAAVPTPVHPAAKAQPEQPAVRSQPLPPVPPPGLTPAYPSGPLRPPTPEPLRPAAAERFATTPAEPAARTSSPTADVPPAGSRANWPLTGEGTRESGELPGPDLASREGRVVPPWQSNDLPAEPPSLRLVEPPLAEPVLADETPAYRTDLGDVRLEPRALRLVAPKGDETARGAEGRGDELPRRLATSSEPSEPAAKDEADGDLLIFAEARSAWFTDHFGEDDAELEFSNASDEGWRAARHAAEPTVGAATESGLPRRVPQQNLVPGSPLSSPERPLRVVRDPAAIAAHTSGYFRGWRRGQEVGGYRVGGRPGRESSGGWDFSRDQEGDDQHGFEYRSARR